MIIDLNKFIKQENRYWEELESILQGLQRNTPVKMDIRQVKRFHYLYQRTSADLAKISTFSAEKELKRYLETLVGSAFSEIHETRQKAHRLAPIRWFFHTFPGVFRKHVRAFWLSLFIMSAGFLFGGSAMVFDPVAKEVLMPFPHLQMDPSERVAREESALKDRLENRKTSFSSYLMTHNTRVAVLTMSLGVTWGIGTILLLFGNGIMLGAVAMDYVLSGETVFLLGWLMPHGSLEIPAILLAGQAGFILAGALLGWGKPVSFHERFRKISGDLVTIILGIAVMLVFAGIIEAFLSQYHQPVLGYKFKITFGAVELVLLILFFWKSGTRKA